MGLQRVGHDWATELNLWSWDCSMPGLPIHHQLPEFTQTHVHWVEDAIQPSHPLLSPSPPAFNLSWHQGLFKWVSSSYQVARVLEFQLQHQSFQRIFRTDHLYDGVVGSPCNPRDFQESSPTPQFKSINSSLLIFLCSLTLTSICDHKLTFNCRTWYCTYWGGCQEPTTFKPSQPGWW